MFANISKKIGFIGIGLIVLFITMLPQQSFAISSVTVNGWTVVKAFNVDPGKRWDGNSNSSFASQWVNGVKGCYRILHKSTAYGNGGYWTTSEETWQSWKNTYLKDVYSKIDGNNGYDLYGGQESGPLDMCFINCWENEDPTETATSGKMDSSDGHDCVAIHYKQDSHPVNCYCPTACTGVSLKNMKWLVENVPIGSIYYEYTSTNSSGWANELGLELKELEGNLYTDGKASTIYNSVYERGTRDDNLTIADTPSWLNNKKYLSKMASYATSLGVTHQTDYMIITDYELARMVVLKKTTSTLGASKIFKTICAKNIGSTSATISYTTPASVYSSAKNENVKISLCLSTNYNDAETGKMAIAATTFKSSYGTLVATSLKPNTKYYYSLLYKDTYGNQVISSVHSFTTSALVENSPCGSCWAGYCPKCGSYSTCYGDWGDDGNDNSIAGCYNCGWMWCDRWNGGRYFGR